MAIVKIAVLLLMGYSFLIESAFAASLEDAHRLIVQGKHVDAVLALEEWTRQYPRDYKAQFLLGKEYARSNRFNKAIETFQLVSGLRPELAEPHANLAAIFNALGNYQAAAKELNLYLDRDPDAPVAHVNLASLYVKLALQQYKLSTGASPNPALQVKINRLQQVLHDGVVTQTKRRDMPLPEAAKPVSLKKKQ